MLQYMVSKEIPRCTFISLSFTFSVHRYPMATNAIGVVKGKMKQTAEEKWITHTFSLLSDNPVTDI